MITNLFIFPFSLHELYSMLWEIGVKGVKQRKK